MLFLLSASTSTDADKLYKAEQWDKAEKSYEHLLKSSPTNRIYNHRYGVCLVEQSKELAKAEKHLRTAQQRGIALSNYYLGRVCFMQYKFDEAIEYYNTYVRKSTDKERKDLALAQIPQCEQASSMLERTEDVEILDRFMVDRSSFFTHYKLSKETGTIVEDPQVISEDSICKDCTIYMTERQDRTFFSVNGDSSNIDLFYKNRLLDQWSDRVNLGENVNTPFDEAYPFLMSDGVVLYFSSKGHDALGGYDIFVTRFNAAQNKFLPPQQLGMPFNSPNDDLLFVIDEYRNVGWFASDRFCPDGKIYIYTFVPNSTIKLLNTDDKELLRQAAIIADVERDSSRLVSQELEKGHGADKAEDMPQKAIYFVVNDTLIYSALGDFMSDDAKDLYLDFLSAEAAYDSIALAMRARRIEYSKTIDPAAKSDLISTIVKLEERQLNLGDERDELEQSVRRLEIETIRLNGGYKKPKPQQVEAPQVVKKQDEVHLSPWESQAVSIKKDSIKEAFFYNKSLLPYYRQIYTPKAVNELIDANRLRIEASDKLFLADYVMKEFNKPVPEEGVFEKMFAHDTSFTEALSFDQMVKKVTQFRDDASRMMIESSLNNYYTLHGQNVLLLETVSVSKVRQQMEGIMDNATFAMQEAKQQLYVSGHTLTEKAEKRSRGNGLLRKSIQYQEAASLVYLQYRYEKAQQLKAEKPMPVINEATTIEPVEKAPVVEREVLQAKEVAIDTIQVQTKEEYRIQFGLFSRMLKEGEIDLPQISYYQYSNKLLYKYYSGHYSTTMEAAMDLEAVKAKGYKDAFVVKFVDGVPE